MALAAQGHDVLKLIVKQGISLVLVGVAIGVNCFVRFDPVDKNLLFGVSATDPTTIAGVHLLLTCVALLACYIPARRATKVDPLWRYVTSRRT